MPPIPAGSPDERVIADEVVLVDEQGSPIGTAPRATVHTSDTPLHLAFSCHVTDIDGRVLVTRRALSKRAWPGVWTNSFCGHPRPGESFADAVVRRGRFELGIDVTGVEPVLPGYRYRAVDASGVVEHEICPVYRATTTDAPAPNPDEVLEWRWVPAAELADLARTAPWTLSPWAAEQFLLLPAASDTVA